MRRLSRCVAAALAVAIGVSICEAAPRVDIRIIPRPRTEPDTLNLGPFPFRAPNDPSGPFSGYVDSVGCMTNFATEIEGKSVLLDICHLKNVTFVEVPPAQASTDQAVGEPQTADENAVNPWITRRQILGIFHGWKIDPIHKKFKYAIFDDGDICGEYGTERFSVAVELVPSVKTDTTPRVYDVRKLSTCSYALRVEAYVAEYELFASSGIHTPGVLDISDADEMLPKICGEMKCQYSHVQGRVDTVKLEIESLKKSLEEMLSSDSTSVAALSVSAASSIIKSSTDVMEKALELLQTIEQLEQDAADARAVAKATTIGETTDLTATS